MTPRSETLESRPHAGSHDAANGWLFFRRWLANPLEMGSVVPSSPALCRRIVRAARRGPDEHVLELGAGTGVVSRALLESGVPPERLTVVEIVPSMAAWLARTLPGAQVVAGVLGEGGRVGREDGRRRVGGGAEAGEGAGRGLAVLMDHRRHEVARGVVVELEDELAEVGLEGVVACRQQRVEELDLLGDHRLGLDDAARHVGR